MCREPEMMEEHLAMRVDDKRLEQCLKPISVMDIHTRRDICLDLQDARSELAEAKARNEELVGALEMIVLHASEPISVIARAALAKGEG